MDDDPREVLALLNSLGFIGITAQQLKAFMKDLKLYRKVKDRERHDRKEEIKRKIINKQQCMIKEILREQRTELHLIENTISTNSSSSYLDGSHVKVKVKCVSSEKENRNSVNSEENINIQQNFDITKSTAKSKKILDHCSLKSNNIPYDNENRKSFTKHTDMPTGCPKKEPVEKQTKKEIKNEMHREKITHLQSARPISAPNIFEFQQDHIASSQTKSTTSTKNTHSGTKSFIRPWNLQPNAQKGLSIRKSDPVALYQKYQQEWKQISFPGEAKHASVRWAIREKMLGGDPHPMPLPRKSSSLPTLRRK